MPPRSQHPKKTPWSRPWRFLAPLRLFAQALVLVLYISPPPTALAQSPSPHFHAADLPKAQTRTLLTPDHVGLKLTELLNPEAKAVVVFVNGMMGNKNHWLGTPARPGWAQKIYTQAPAHTYTAHVRYDGWNGSRSEYIPFADETPPQDIYGFDRMIMDIVTIAEKLKKEHPHLPLYFVTHSRGGMLAKLASAGVRHVNGHSVLLHPNEARTWSENHISGIFALGGPHDVPDLLSGMMKFWLATHFEYLKGFLGWVASHYPVQGSGWYKGLKTYAAELAQLDSPEKQKFVEKMREVALNHFEWMLRHDNTPEVVRNFLDGATFNEQLKEMSDFMRYGYSALHLSSIMNVIHWSVRGYSSIDGRVKYSGLPIYSPLFIVNGSVDPVTPMDMTLREALLNGDHARIALLEGVGHLGLLSEKVQDRFGVDALLDFIRNPATRNHPSIYQWLRRGRCTILLEEAS